MFILSKGETIPEGRYNIVHNEDGSVICYESDDIETITKNIKNLKSLKTTDILIKYAESERNLSVNKNDYRDMQAAIIAGVDRGGRDLAETRQAFKDAVIARQSIQDKRDSLLSDIKNAATIEELNLINWHD